MKQSSVKRFLCLVLCTLMLCSVVPLESFADEDYDAHGATEAYDPGIPEVPASQGSGNNLSSQEIQAVIRRNMGTWYFPVPEHFFANISDFCGCRGGNKDVLYGVSYGACKFSGHSVAAWGNPALHIEVYYDGTEIMAPTSGTMYRNAWGADPLLGNSVVIEQSAGNGYSYYIILAHVSSNAPVASGTNVAGGNLVAYSEGYPLQLSCMMDYSGKGQQFANSLSSEIDRVSKNGWLTESYGVGMICVNPSQSNRPSSHRNYITDFLDGAVTYAFTTPTYIDQPTTPTEAPTVPTTPTAPTEPPIPTVPPTEPAHTHVFNQQVAVDAYLVRPASCSGPAVYAYSCVCGTRGSDTFNYGSASGHRFATGWSADVDYHWHAAICEHTAERDSYGLHNWDAGRMTVQPTHTTAGEKTYTCTICGAQKKEAAPASAEHVYDRRVEDSRYLASNATCTTPAQYYFSCVCGEKGTTTFQSGNALGHTFATEWSKDANYHWHAATCEHKNEVGNMAAHNWDSGTTEVQAGHMTPGRVRYTCVTCGQTRTENVPGASHVFDRQVVDNKYLVSNATCTSPAVYYKSCACGEKGTETFLYGEAKGHSFSSNWSFNDRQHWRAATCEHVNEKTQLGDHTWNAGEITLQPTPSSKGVKTYTCTTCRMTRTEEVAPSEHQHTYSSAWTGNESYHWHAATCEHSTSISGFGEHNWNGGVVTSYASHSVEGKKVYTCLTCNYTKTETVPALHVFDQRNTSAYYLKSNATCTSAAVYYFSCSCGAKGTQTFTYGSPSGHSYSGNWMHDDNSHWRVCQLCGGKGDLNSHYFGTANSCTTCGYTKQDSHIHTSHLSRVPAKTATCTQPGNIAYYICSCGKWFTDTTATMVITDQNSVVTPATGHVDKDNNGKCDICKERLSTQTVTYTITEGADSTWLNTSNQGLVFRSNAEYSKFDHVEVDGATISSLNYVVSSGSTVVELNANYMKRLTVGQHKISVVASDGKADANFTIKQGSASAASGSEGGRSPLWIVVAIIAVLSLIAAACVGGYILVSNRSSQGGRFSK